MQQRFAEWIDHYFAKWTNSFSLQTWVLIGIFAFYGAFMLTDAIRNRRRHGIDQDDPEDPNL